jgi:hypothetical protein
VSENPTIEGLIDLIGELGREAHYLLDDCEESGPVGDSTFTVTQKGVAQVSSVLDRIEALPFEAPGCILGPGAMLQEALKQTIAGLQAAARKAAMMAAAREATSFLVGNPEEGVPLRNPYPHEIAARIRAAADVLTSPTGIPASCTMGDVSDVENAPRRVPLAAILCAVRASPVPLVGVTFAKSLGRLDQVAPTVLGFTWDEIEAAALAADKQGDPA